MYEKIKKKLVYMYCEIHTLFYNGKMIVYSGNDGEFNFLMFLFLATFQNLDREGHGLAAFDTDNVSNSRNISSVSTLLWIRF